MFHSVFFVNVPHTYRLHCDHITYNPWKSLLRLRCEEATTCVCRLYCSSCSLPGCIGARSDQWTDSRSDGGRQTYPTILFQLSPLPCSLPYSLSSSLLFSDLLSSPLLSMPLHSFLGHSLLISHPVFVSVCFCLPARPSVAPVTSHTHPA